MSAGPAAPVARTDPDPQEQVERLLRDLRSRRTGLTEREAVRRLTVSGRNELVRSARTPWMRLLAQQLVHPLALLLWAAAVFALVDGTVPLALAIVAVVLLNAVFAFGQEQHAERAVEALTAYLPQHAVVVRDGATRTVDASTLVPGDVVVVAEGDRVCADARLLDGSVEMDISMLTGESLPVLRTPDAGPTSAPLLEAPDIVFSGSACTGGEAHALVFATGMRTEVGRIAALSQRVGSETSPLQQQVSRVAKLIAVVAVVIGLAFIPLGMLAAGLSFSDTLTFAIGLLVANVPEGLLPTITLALAIGVRVLAREGALVKKISAVETLGSTTVICTDKTGTLTQNRMRVVAVWTPACGAEEGDDLGAVAPAASHLAGAAAGCTTARTDDQGHDEGDPTELALLAFARDVGVPVDPAHPDRVALLHFDPNLRRMSTVDRDAGRLLLTCKGAPEEVLPLCAVGDTARQDVLDQAGAWARDGRRVLAVAQRTLPAGTVVDDRATAESGLTLLGIVAMTDPPRPEVAGAVRLCHDAGIRLVVATGDHAATAEAVAHQVGIGRDGAPVVTGREMDLLSDDELDALLRENRELIVARSSPEAKLRIADALQAQGNVVAMTGDGVNDAPALRAADIGVAMGRSGTDVAREAATMVLVDDNFATIVSAVAAGRRVYDNVRKFIVYIFAHATPEVVPFLLYALSGGRIPLPLTVMQILAIDLGTETLPALALGREPAEPGTMTRPPRMRGRGVIDREMLVRAWLLLGGVSAFLVTALFLLTLVDGGWTPGAAVSSGPMRHVWQQATTMTFLGIVACQVGTALAARTQRASLRSIGLLSNPLLLWGIAFEVVFAAVVVVVPWCQEVFGTAVPPLAMVALLLPLPVAVWGVDEAVRAYRRRQPAQA